MKLRFFSHTFYLNLQYITRVTDRFIFFAQMIN